MVKRVAQMAKKQRLTGGYPCPNCQTSMAVINSRPFESGIRRRRGCPKCEHRISTVESVEDDPGKSAWRDVPVTAALLANVFDAYCGADGHNLVVREALSALGKRI